MEQSGQLVAWRIYPGVLVFVAMYIECDVFFFFSLVKADPAFSRSCVLA